MILNVSGRTDIVAFYSKWFINRYRKGYVDVRNPIYPKNVSRIYFDDVDAIIFCTKNPLPILEYLKEINKPIIFHVTLTPYKKDIEPNVPSKKEIIAGIKKLSNIVGINNIYIRYDPVFISDKYNIDYHIRAFDRICTLLNGYVKHIIISFIDNYKNVQKNYKYLKFYDLNDEDYRQIGINFASSAKRNNMTVQTCFEDKDLTEYGFIKEDCLSHTCAYKLTGKIGYKSWKARKGKKCNCVEMVDIGEYNSCMHFCRYCYANFDEKKVIDNYKRHNPSSSLLIGKLKQEDNIKVRGK